jgi:hypothetical protein
MRKKTSSRIPTTKIHQTEAPRRLKTRAKCRTRKQKKNDSIRSSASIGNYGDRKTLTPGEK